AQTPRGRRHRRPSDIHSLGHVGHSPLFARSSPTDQRDLRQGAPLRFRERDRLLHGATHPAGRAGARGAGRVSLIDDALKRAQAMDRVSGDRPSAWTPTHLPDRRPGTRRAVGIAAGLLGAMLLALWAWKSLPKREAPVRVAA